MEGVIAQVKNVERIWLSNKEAQTYLGMKQDFFAYLRKSGQLPYYQIGAKPDSGPDSQCQHHGSAHLSLYVV